MIRHHTTQAAQTGAPTTRPTASRSRRWSTRLAAAASTTIGTISGLAPHLLHHIAPIAGAALFTGAAGSVLFGVLGFLLMTPMLLRLRRRFGTWLAPAAMLAVFLAMFTISTVWIGPAIRGDVATPSTPQQVDPHGH